MSNGEGLVSFGLAMMNDATPSKDVTGLLDAGFGNTVPRYRVVSIVDYNSTPVMRACQELEKMHRVIDATKGRKIKSVVFLDSTHAILSAVAHETLAERFQNQ